MTAFNDILTIEAEAMQSIETAKTEATAAIAAAHATGQSRIETVSKELQAASEKELASHASNITDTTSKIQAEVNNKVFAIEKRFDAQTTVLTQELKKRFA